MHPKHMIQLTLKGFAYHGGQAEQVRRPSRRPGLNL